MRQFIVSLTLAAATALIGTTAYADVSTDPVKLLLEISGLDLSNATIAKRLTSDRRFRSNDPRMQGRLYRFEDGQRVKLYGHKFKSAKQIDKITVIYNAQTEAFTDTAKSLTEAFGPPNEKQPGTLTWRVENPNSRETQAKFVRVLISQNKSGKWTISADRRLGKRGNNVQRDAKAKAKQHQSLARSTTATSTERD